MPAGNVPPPFPILVLCLAVAAAIFVADLMLPLGVASGVPYVVLVLLGLWLPWRRATLALAAVATLLTVVGLLMSAPLGDPLIVLTNRALAIGAVWIVAALTFVHRTAWQRLRDDQARLAVVTKTAIDGIVVIDTDGIIRMTNPACERLFGYTTDEMVGRNVSMLMPSPDRERHDGYLRHYLETGEKRLIGIGREVRARRRDGSLFPIQLAVGEASLSGRRMFTGFIHDLTQRKLAEQRAQDLQSELYRVSRLGELGEMAAAIAHELNQPLSAAGNYIEAARETLRRGDGEAAAKADGMMAKAVAQLQRASDVIRHIRAMASGGETERQPEDVNELVAEAARLALIGAEAKGVSASLELAPGLPTCSINRTQVQQVVLNLVRNSVEVLETSEHRNVRVQTSRRDATSVEVAVVDTGPGLSSEVADRLFRAFVTTKPNGMGIGLSISRSIVQAHGGELWAEPNEGGGTVFRFTLPSLREVDQERSADAVARFEGGASPLCVTPRTQ